MDEGAGVVGAGRGVTGSVRELSTEDTSGRTQLALSAGDRKLGSRTRLKQYGLRPCLSRARAAFCAKLCPAPSGDWRLASLTHPLR